MEISVLQLFNLFVHHLGHKVKPEKHEQWNTSPEGWEHHALLHMIYWMQRDFKGLSHIDAWTVASSSQSELLEKLLNELFDILKTNKKSNFLEDI